MTYDIRLIAKQSHMHYRRMTKLLAEFEWIIRFKDLEIIINHDYLTWDHQRLCFTEKGVIEFNLNLIEKFRGGN